MKTYQDNKILKWSWLKRQNYLPASDALGNASSIGWRLIEKFPIEKIQFNKSTYPNKINPTQVIEMINEFYPFGFYPIRIDGDGNLKDGQHRLKFAQLCGWRYIDVWIE